MTHTNTFEISNEEVAQELAGKTPTFPKYTTQILNLCSRNAKATWPFVVGKMSELVQECPYNTYEEWRKWYLSKKPNAIQEAALRIKGMIRNIKDALSLIDDEMIKTWVDDLVITKSFAGIRFQKAILSHVAKLKGTTFRMAEPAEESKGIDGYIGQDQVSIKPITYKLKPELRESIRIPILYYEKLKNGIRVDASSILQGDQKLC